MKERSYTKDFLYIILAFILLGIVIIFFNNLTSPQGFIFICICSFIVVIGFAYLINLLLMLFTSKDRTDYVLPISCGAICIISFIVGLIIYMNDSGFLKGLEAEIIWVFISAPAFVCAIVYLIILVVKLAKKKSE